MGVCVCAGDVCGLSGLHPRWGQFTSLSPHTDPFNTGYTSSPFTLAFMAPCKSLSGNTSLSVLLWLSFQHIYPHGEFKEALLQGRWHVGPLALK